MDPEFADNKSNMFYYLDLHLTETWNAIGNDLKLEYLRASFGYLRRICDYSDFHQMTWVVLVSHFQNLILESNRVESELLHAFILDDTMSVAGRNNAAWIVLGIIGHLVGQPVYNTLVNDCIYMLLKNMTIGVELDQVSLNICYYEHLDVDSAVKKPGIGLFALIGLHMQMLWPICCQQLQRILNEEGGLLKSIKLLIGLFDSEAVKNVRF